MFKYLLTPERLYAFQVFQNTVKVEDGFATALILNQGSIEHVINAINKNGEIYFVDTQIGKIVELNSNIKLTLGRP